MDIVKELHSLLAKQPSAPFLFVGSGFSRRYIGLEDWDGLLERFCTGGKPYGYYKSSANQDTPTAARLLAEEFYNYWWSDNSFEEKRKQNQDRIINKTSPLRLEISEYLAGISAEATPLAEYNHELEALAKCDVDGVITTNWDLLLERIFPSYKVYIGQKELLFSNPLSIAEIYKIHGCCSDPQSLILTDGDYADYNERNAYLAAKLITIFVEHPVIFIGYSLTDPNIRALLKSVAACIGTENITKLQNNLIFLDRNEEASGPTIETAYLQFETTQIPAKVVKTKDFALAYQAIAMFERQMPAKVLRFCKERVFEIVKGTTPEKKIAVVDFESIEDPSSIEVVFGIGVASSLGQQGYVAISVDDLFEDLILNTKKYNAKHILEITLPALSSGVKFVPIYKHLRAVGIKTLDQYKISGLKCDRFMRKLSSEFTSNASLANLKKYENMGTAEFLLTASESEIFSLLPLLNNVRTKALGEYLNENFENIMSGKYKYQYRRIMAFYDWLKYGFEPQ